VLFLSDETLNESKLKGLFYCGEKYEKVLFKALDSKNEISRLNAQYMIRLLNIRKGLDLISERYKQNPEGFAFIGPIPTPIHDVDIQRIERKCRRSSLSDCELTPDFLFALSVDNSDLLTTFRSRVEPNRFQLSKGKIDPTRMEESIAQICAFILKEGKNAKITLLGYNERLDKRLLSININRGPLATELYYVVIEKVGADWHLLSLNEVSFS